MAHMLIIGATGGIGKQAMLQLLANSQVAEVRAMVRSPEKLPQDVRENPKLKIIQVPSVVKLTVQEMAEHMRGCEAVLMCLGHVLSFSGIFFSGYLVSDANVLVCDAIQSLKQKVKFIQVNTIGVASPDGLDDRNRGMGNNIIVGGLAAVLPPFIGSRRAAAYMYKTIGRDHPYIEWCVVRPDTLLDKPAAAYTVHDTVPWSITKPLETNRASVAQFMGALVLDPELWSKWKGKFPIVLNDTSSR